MHKNKNFNILQSLGVFIVGGFLFVSFFYTNPAHAASLIDIVRGRILLQVDLHGEAWYVYPFNDHRYYMADGNDAYTLMRELGLGITDANLAKIPKVGDSWNAPADLMRHVQGRILLQVQKNGEAWYVNPVNGRRYYMANGDDAYALMRSLGLGISMANIEHIPLTADPTEPGVDFTHHESRTIQTDKGSFSIELIQLQKSRYIMKTDTGNTSDCSNNCTVKSLQQYVSENGAAIGIHGTYFCPPDYSSCAGKINTFLPPVFNTDADKMINEKTLQFHSGPLLTYTTDNAHVYYDFFHRTHDFANTIAEYEGRSGRQVNAAIANYPSLIEDGAVVVEQEPLEQGQRTTKAVRGGIGYDKNAVYLVVARGATVIDLAYIFKALRVQNAMNLDGGGSTALYFSGKYVYGPGRLLPNAIVFKKR